MKSSDLLHDLICDEVKSLINWDSVHRLAQRPQHQYSGGDINIQQFTRVLLSRSIEELESVGNGGRPDALDAICATGARVKSRDNEE